MSSILFPKLNGFSWDVKLAPYFKTIVQEAASGREVRAALYQYPRWELTLSYEYLRANPAMADDSGLTELDKIVGFFLQRQGSFDSFLLNLSDLTRRDKDSIVQGQKIGVGDGSTTSFQLTRSIGGYADIAQFPAGQSARVRVAGALKTPGADYTISNGLVTFATAPASGASITADFTALWSVRFKQDQQEFDQLMYLLWECREVHLVSVRV